MARAPRGEVLEPLPARAPHSPRPGGQDERSRGRHRLADDLPPVATESRRHGQSAHPRGDSGRFGRQPGRVPAGVHRQASADARRGLAHPDVRKVRCMSLFPEYFLEVQAFYQDDVNATFRVPQIRQLVRRIIVTISFCAAHGTLVVQVYPSATAFRAPVMCHSGHHRNRFVGRNEIPAIRVRLAVPRAIQLYGFDKAAE